MKIANKYTYGVMLIVTLTFANNALALFDKKAYRVNSGVYSSSVKGDSCNADSQTCKASSVFKKKITVPGANAIMLKFADYNLGKSSYLEITSAKDGAKERLTNTVLKQWYNHSVIFNGNTVNLELYVAPGDSGIYANISHIFIDNYKAHKHELGAICGNIDTRVESDRAATGRLLPIVGTDPCTTEITSSGALLTAGHCITSDGISVAEFNVPVSTCKGEMQHPKPIDQYSVDQDSILYHSPSSGDNDDWAIYDVFTNLESHVKPGIAQGSFYRPTQYVYPIGTMVRLIGYGTTVYSPTKCNKLNYAQKTGTGKITEIDNGPDLYWVLYRADSTSSDSGAPILIDGTKNQIAIHTNGGCKEPPIFANGGNPFTNPTLAKRLNGFFGTNVKYLDVNSPSTKVDGTIFNPYTQLLDAISAANDGDTISIAAGTYSIYKIDASSKNFTLTTPVGNVSLVAQ